MGRYVHLPNSLLGTHQVPSALPGRGGMSFLLGAWHHGGDLWHDPMLYKGGGGQRPPPRRHLQKPCIVPGWCFQMGRLIGLEPPLPASGGQSSTDAFLPLWGEEDCIYCISRFKWQLWVQHSSIAASGTVGHQDLLGSPVHLWVVV